MRHSSFILVLLLFSCSSPQQKPIIIEKVGLGVKPVNNRPKYLSEWGFFKEPMKGLIPAEERLIPYEINSALFSDYAHKARFIRLPEGKAMSYHETEVLDFPKETILIKNFYYPFDFRSPEAGRMIIETRLLINSEEGWEPIVYQWNEEQTEAERVILGKRVPVEWTDEAGKLQRINYSIPSQPQCKSCHDMGGKFTPLGPSARQLNRDRQLSEWKENGWLNVSETSFPQLTNYEDGQATLDARARAWLEVNCAHCHRREGPAKNSGLYLLTSQTDPYRLGVNKPPIAAGKGSGGLKYSIVPGKPDQSILVHRIESMEPGEMMPELGRKMTHKEGVELIREWIARME